MNYLSAMLDAHIPWHNPDNLTPEQVDPNGEGWRLLLKEEIGSHGPLSQEIEKWTYCCWDDTAWRGGTPTFTYRVKWPLPAKYQSSEGFPPGLPALPEPLAGHRWVYRGKGWRAKDVKYAFLLVGDSEWDDCWVREISYSTCASPNYHYAEAVPLTTQSQPQTTMNKIPYINTTDQPELFEIICQLGEKLGIYVKATITQRRNSGAIALTGPPYGGGHQLDGSALIHWQESRNAEEVTIQTFIELMRKAVARKEEAVKLNDKHTAIVTKGGVTVGCQKFDLSVIDDLVEAKRKVLEG